MTIAKLPPTKKMNLGVIDDLESRIEAARAVATAENVPTTTYPNDKPPEAVPPVAVATLPPSNVTQLPTERKAKAPKLTPVRRFSVDLPVTAIKDIKDKAHAQDKTKRVVLLEALKRGGIKIRDIDITPEVGADDN